jgi:hypothetical protein
MYKDADCEMSDDSREFFRRHDIAHVVFGCDTSLLNEAMVKLWTAFGTTLGFWKHIGAYSRDETTNIARELRPAAVVGTCFRAIALFPRVLARCRAMKKPWPWDQPDPYLKKRLVDVRQEFNIKPIITKVGRSHGREAQQGARGLV